MKRKPSWALWLLMIVAPVAVFLGMKSRKALPRRDPITQTEITFDQISQAAAAAGAPHLSTLRLVSMPANTAYMVRISVFNPKSGIPLVFRQILSGASEVFQDKGEDRPRDGDETVCNCYGTPYCDTNVVVIKKVRQRPIKIRIKWVPSGATSPYVYNHKDVTITPQMKPQN